MPPFVRSRARRPSGKRKPALPSSAFARVEQVLIYCQELLQQGQELRQQCQELRHGLDQALNRNTLQQQQLDRLHTELQEHKNGLLRKLQHPWAMGLVQIYDVLNRSEKDLCVEQQTMTSKDVAAMLESYRQDVEIVLEQQGVTAYKTPGKRFDPARQTAIKTVPAPEPELAGLILLRLRPGFEQEGRVLRKEWVCVYAG